MSDKEGGESRVRRGDEKVAFSKLFVFADRLDVLLMIIGTIGAIANGLTQPLMLVIMSQLINTFGKSGGTNITHEISKVCLLYVYLAIGAGIASSLQVSCWMVSGERQATRIRGLYLKTILRQDIAFFDTETTTGEVIGRMSGDTILIQDAMGEKVGKFMQLTSTFIGGFVIAYIRGWLLALVLTSCIPAVLIAGGFMARILSKMSSRSQVAYAEAGNVVEQTIGAIRTVASFTREIDAIDKYDSKIHIAYATSKHNGIASGLGIGAVLFSVFSTYGLAIWYGSKLIIEKGYDGGKVMNVIMSIITGGISLSQTLPSLSAFSAGQAAAYKMFETINRKPNIDAYDTSGVVLNDINGAIELKDVYFKYPARPDVQIFSGFSLNIPSGVTAALVGQSGSGKSTVISLLERFYDPDSGQVLIDGVDLKRFQLKWLRGNMGLVSQEPILFATSIRSNIAYGKENATEEEIRTAIELANAATFIDKLPEGLDTMVGEHGTQMSGGQKQRIAIARAILKNPKIILLDEATSALDAESESVVQNALEKIMTNRTTVVVAHRLTTIRNADIIAVVHAGKLVEKGTHDELIKDPEGAYTQLVRMQGVGTNQGEETKDVETEEDAKNISSSSSQVLSTMRSLSRGSSRSSYQVSVPDFNHINESKRGDVVNNNSRRENTETEKRKKEYSLWLRLAYLNKPELLVLILGTVAACINGVIFPLFGLLISNAIKIFFEPHSMLRRDSRFWALMYVGLGCVTIVVIPVQNYFFGVAGGKLIQRIRSLTFQKIVHQEISWFDDPANSSGAVGARLSTDATTVRSLVGDALALVVQNMATVVAGVVIAFTANWILALVILAVLPLMLVQGLLQTKFNNGFSADAKVMYEQASQVANDAVGSIRTVASFCAEEKVMDMYQKKCDGPMKSGIRLGIVSGVSLGVGSSVLCLVNSFIFYIGSVLEKHGKATFAEIFRVFFALTMTAIGVSMTIGMAPDIDKVKNSAASIFQILDSKPKIDSSNEEGSTIDTLKGDIELWNVGFKYPTRPNIPIFIDLCLSIPSGKTVALVGESGSGKSTVISLIERFYDPDGGHIYLDGVELQTLNLNWLRQQIGLVGQEPVLFNETIRDNIAYGKNGEATEEEIIAATRFSNAHDFISALPQGYNTNVGERGVQLSGGQKQRIAIARAIIKDPRILLLDEATSALDTESERIVQDALDRVMENRTTVVVAHRLGTIKGADIIAVVKNGVIAEKGNHDSLVSIPNGVYASLVALQMTST
ncbi:ABC transporter B family member 9 [Heracleum sosnowskyi]|uniref:ABC transporter B family member 9 n=1 Tax=Heracleum sosnowskyi TaxID=360622 RepID=A0AAD8I610_9APIA|nr:ABC transporter B family member 9 [Heracleum sosnowskyi]